MTSTSETFSGSLRVRRLAGLGLSLRSWWHAAPGREKDKKSTATRKGRDRAGGSSVEGNLSLEPVPRPHRGPTPAPEQDDAEAALLPPAAHLIMVVCCVED